MVYLLFQVLIIVFVSVIASFQDIKRGRVSDFLLWGGTLAMVLCHIVFCGVGFWRYVVGGVFLAAVFLLARFFAKKRLGMADVYFAGFSGVSLNLRYLWAFVLVSSVAALVYYALMLFLARMKATEDESQKKGVEISNLKIPFVPFLSIGLFAAFALQFIR